MMNKQLKEQLGRMTEKSKQPKIEGEVITETVLSQCRRMSKDSKLDVFFSYSGHIDSFSVRVNFETSYGMDDDPNIIYEKIYYFDESITGITLAEILQDLIGIEYQYEQNESSKVES